MKLKFLLALWATVATLAFAGQTIKLAKWADVIDEALVVGFQLAGDLRQCEYELSLTPRGTQSVHKL